jgi:hypothetical protein
MAIQLFNYFEDNCFSSTCMKMEKEQETTQESFENTTPVRLFTYLLQQLHHETGELTLFLAAMEYIRRRIR